MTTCKTTNYSTSVQYMFDENSTITVHNEQRTSFVIVEKTDSRWFIEIEFVSDSQAARGIVLICEYKVCNLFANGSACLQV